MLRKLPSPHALAGSGCLNPSMLQDTFSLLSNRDVRDFLLSEDSNLEVSLLNSPLQLERAIAASLDVVGYEINEPRDVLGRPPFDYSARAHWLMFPGITVGPYTLGVVVELIVSNNMPFPGLPRGATNTCRFVYDNSSGELLIIDHADGSDFVEINRLAVLSTVAVRKEMIVADISSIRQCVAVPGRIDLAALHSGLHFVAGSKLERFCICGASPRARCGCVFEFKKPKGPHDIEAFEWNCGGGTGGFRITGYTAVDDRVALFDRNGNMRVSGDMLCKFDIVAMEKGNELRKLRACALEKRMAAMRLGNVISSLLPVDEQERCDSMGDTPRLQDGAAMEGLLRGGLDLDEELFQGVDPACAYVTNAIDPIDIHCDPSTPLSKLQEIDFTGTDGTSGLTSLLSGPASPRTLRRPFLQFLENPSISSQHSPLLQDPDTPTNRSTGSVDNDAPSDAGDSATTGCAKPTIDEARAIRLEKRRQRNRASAARSNLKRKMERESLETALRETKRRVEELREKQQKLREQNQFLRGSLHGKSIAPSSKL